MSSPKLTRFLLASLLVINCLFMAGLVISSIRNNQLFAGNHKIHGRFHDRSFRSCFEASRRYHGEYVGNFRDHRNFNMCNCSRNNKHS